MESHSSQPTASEPDSTGSPLSSSRSSLSLRLSLTLAALGVVFGDIGTSPLYALRECFVNVGGAPSPANVMGALSLIFWTLTLVVSVKYVGVVMKTDNKGEGGILALMALALHQCKKGKKQIAFISTLGILGAALLYSDGIITPAISVLSAVEGLTEATPFFQPFIVPLSLIILTGLFLVQSRGTARVGTFFGPILIIWFATLAILGIRSIILHPAVLASVNPLFAYTFLVSHGWHSLLILGAVFLTVTGAEVLYADLGHFGRTPIISAWFVLVFPSLILNYFGQGAILISSTGPVGHLFYRLAPDWFLLPLIILSTAATVIASQAVISGAFSLARQSVQLGFWPRIQILHTSEHTIGQVYVPFMNGLLWIGTMLLILFFQESGRLAAAYGIAVSATMFITTILTMILSPVVWKKRLALFIPYALVFVMIDISFFSANIMKIRSGGWIVMLIAVGIFLLMATWIRGRRVLGAYIAKSSMKLEDFVLDIAQHEPFRVDGTAVFLSANPNGVPRALLHSLKHYRVLHRNTVILQVSTTDVPVVPFEERITTQDLGCGLHRISLSYGFSESPDVPATLAAAEIPGLSFSPMSTTYFLGREALVLTNRAAGLPRWMKQLYAFMAHNSLNATNFFGLPPNRVVELGSQNEF